MSIVAAVLISIFLLLKTIGTHNKLIYTLSSKNYLKKHKNHAILETGVALETEGLEVVQTHLSTLLTGTSEEEVSATLETRIALAIS